MKVSNTSYLRDLLIKGGLPQHVHRESFDFDPVEYDRHLAEVCKQFPTHLNEERAARAAYRTLTHNGKGLLGPHVQMAKEIALPEPLTKVAKLKRHAIFHGPVVLKIAAIVVGLILLAVIAWK